MRTPMWTLLKSLKMTRSARLLLLSLTGAFTIAGCEGGGDPAAAPPSALPETRPEAPPAASDLESAFARAAAESGVPATLLKAIAYAETRFYHVPGAASEFEGQAPAYGLMALRGERLQRGAQLAGLTVEEVRNDSGQNVRAAAALLAAEARALGLDPARLGSNLGAWAPVVARASGIADREGQAHYVHAAVYPLIRDGIPGEELMRVGLRFTPEPQVQPDFAPMPPSDPATLVGYSGAKWLPAPASNFTKGRSSTIQWLVIHTCAGGYSGCLSWLRTPYPTNPNKTSAHYIVNESGGEIAQLVDEIDTAHHVGASWMGLSTNPRSVGIEHGGFPYEGSNKWTEGQVAASAKLSCDVVKRNRIIQDRNHIIGHYQPDPVNRATDPGRSFPWADYMNRISTCTGGGPSGFELIIDSNQANNDPAKAKINTPSSSWVSSSNVSGYWGSGYYAAPTASVSDAAVFEFKLDAAGSKEVFAWWTAATDRSKTTPFIITSADGKVLGTVNKDQQTNGGRWNSLGTYNFPAGWNKVSVSRWTAAGAQVIADAVRVADE